MENQPLISVVLPVHNGSQYVDDAIASVVGQTFSNWELIIVNDASTDDTPSKLDCWAGKDPRIRVIHLESNRLLPGALNVGFAQATGAFFTWTSDDNVYRPNALERMLQVLQDRSDVGVVCADFSYIDDQGDLMFVRQLDDVTHIYEGNCIGACFLYRKEVHHALGGYDESLFLAEDYDFWLRAFTRFAIHTLHEDLYVYRYHRKSLTIQRAKEVELARQIAILRSLPIPNHSNRDLLAKAYISLTKSSRRLKLRWRARKYIVAAFRLSPSTARRCYSTALATEVVFGKTAGRLVDWLGHQIRQRGRSGTLPLGGHR